MNHKELVEIGRAIIADHPIFPTHVRHARWRHYIDRGRAFRIIFKRDQNRKDRKPWDLKWFEKFPPFYPQPQSP